MTREQLRTALSKPISWFGCPNCGYGPCGCDSANEDLVANRKRMAVALFALVRAASPGADDASDLALVKKWI